MRQVMFVLENDIELSQLLRLQFEQAGYSVRAVTPLIDPAGVAKDICSRLLLLDVTVPEGADLDLGWCLQLNEGLGMTPIVFLSAKNKEKVPITGLDAGSGRKEPLSPREFVTYVNSALPPCPPLLSGCVRVGDLEIDSDAMLVSLGGKPISLTNMEFKLIEYLARHAGRVFARDQILKAVWPDGQFVTPHSVDVYVWRLRGKIEPTPENPIYLKTVRGAGYRFAAPEGNERNNELCVGSR